MNVYQTAFHAPAMMEALRNSSVSAEDANIRANEYAKMFSRNDEMKETFGLANGSGLLQKTFSGYAETPLLSNQYFNASVASYVSSFAGYMSIERDFDQPNGLFYWFDVLGVTDNRTVVPNLGPDSYSNIETMAGWNLPVKVQGTSYTVVVGKKILPGTVRVKVVSPGDSEKYELIDDGQGHFLSVPGKITGGSITYVNGLLQFTLAAAPTAAGEGDSAVNPTITAVGKEDVTGTPSNFTGSTTSGFDKRFIAKMQQLALSTAPDMLVAEYNIAALGAMKKATGTDMATFLFTKLRELYTKLINYKLVSTLEQGYNGNTMDTLNLGVEAMSGQFHDYRSRVDLFDAYLVNVESALATKAVKGVKTTAYVAGNQAANQFQKGSVIGKWESNTKMTYINDLLGWYNGIPVLRSTDIQENTEGNQATFYAIHKTADGQMAPLARGIYMPLTDTPTIGNYNNPTQMASGIYYQEGTRYMAPELVQKITFTYGI